MEIPMNPFNVSDLQDSDNDYSPASDGSHPVKIVTADDRINQSQTGRYVLLEFKILSGPDKGKKVKDYCTHQHPNPKAVAAGMGRIKRVMEACGIDSVEDETDLLGLKLNIVTEIEDLPEDSQFKPQARVKRYEKIDDSVPAEDVSDDVAEDGDTPF
jgi:hypothetical protein